MLTDNLWKSRNISNKWSAFQGKELKEYFSNENIERTSVTTGISRGNVQIERFHRTLKLVLLKLSIDDPTKWYKHASFVQRILNILHI